MDPVYRQMARIRFQVYMGEQRDPVSISLTSNATVPLKMDPVYRQMARITFQVLSVEQRVLVFQGVVGYHVC